MSIVNKTRVSLLVLAAKLFQNRSDSPGWVSTCKRCGEWLATDKKHILDAHATYCTEYTGYAEGQGLSAKQVLALALGGAGFGALMALIGLV